MTLWPRIWALNTARGWSWVISDVSADVTFAILHRRLPGGCHKRKLSVQRWFSRRYDNVYAACITTTRLRKAGGESWRTPEWLLMWNYDCVWMKRLWSTQNTLCTGSKDLSSSMRFHYCIAYAQPLRSADLVKCNGHYTAESVLCIQCKVKTTVNKLMPTSLTNI